MNANDLTGRVVKVFFLPTTPPGAPKEPGDMTSNFHVAFARRPFLRSGGAGEGDDGLDKDADRPCDGPSGD